jgi:hypothetical protein
MNLKFGTLEKDIKLIVVELKAESAKIVAELKVDTGKHEVAMRKDEAGFMSRVIFTVSVLISLCPTFWLTIGTSNGLRQRVA